MEPRGSANRRSLAGCEAGFNFNYSPQVKRPPCAMAIPFRDDYKIDEEGLAEASGVSRVELV